MHELRDSRTFPLGSVFLSGTLLGGSWVVISGLISRVSILITHIGALITLTFNYP